MRTRVLALGFGFLLAAGCGAAGGGTDAATAADPGTTTDPGTAGGFESLYAGYFKHCANCHAPGAPGGGVDGIETALDFTSAATAKATLKSGRAAGLKRNAEACNGVAFVGATYGESLVAATVDESVRGAFSAPGQPDCNTDAVGDMTVKVGAAPSPAWLDALKAWIDGGAA